MPRDSETTKTDRALLEEIAQRSRRTETRTVKIANHLGIDTGEKPVLRGSSLSVPSRKVTLEDVIAAIGEHSGAVSVWCGEDYLATVGL